MNFKYSFKIILIILAFSGLSLSSCIHRKIISYQPKLSSICIVDRDGLSETLSGKDRLNRYECVNFLAPQPYQKVIRVFQRKPDGTIPAQLTTYHPNGQVKQYLDSINNRAHGIYREWHENGSLKIDARVIGGSGDLGPSHENTWLFEGKCQAWDEDGNQEAAIFYSKGVQEGESIYFHKNGSIWKKVPYHKGVLHGTEETFLENKELLQICEFSNGLREGKTIRFWNYPKIASEEYFEKGKLKKGIYYDLDGKILSEVKNGTGDRVLFGKNTIAETHEYNDGELNGKVKLFNQNREVFNLFHVKNGIKHGEDIEYYPEKPNQKNRLQKMSIQWFEGNIQGLVKTWYPNGKQESQREMSKNQKNGLATAWYEDGSLMLIEEYEADKLKQGKYFKKGNKLPISTIRDGNGTATLFDSQGNFLKKINYNHSQPEI